MVLIGASGHSKVIRDILDLSGFDVVCLYDDRKLEKFNSIPVNSPISGIPDYTEAIISIGDNYTRKRISDSYTTLKYQIATHPQSVIDESVSIGEGTVVMASATINNSTVIGKHCIINTSSSIDHDCVIEDYIHLSPGAVLCGGIHVSEGSHIGAGAVVSPNLKIGKWATIGAGAVVINNIPDYAVVVGNPGKIIKYNER